MTPVSQLHNYNIRNGYIYLNFPSHEQNGEDGLRILKVLTIRLAYLLHLRDQSRTFQKFKEILFVSFMYSFLMQF